MGNVVIRVTGVELGGHSNELGCSISQPTGNLSTEYLTFPKVTISLDCGMVKTVNMK